MHNLHTEVIHKQRRNISFNKLLHEKQYHAIQKQV